jgi:hypothetical protein
MLEFLPDIVQHHAALERDRAQMRRQQGEGVWRQCPQETIESSGFELPGKRGCAIRHGVCSYITTARCGQHAVITVSMVATGSPTFVEDDSREASNPKSSSAQRMIASLVGTAP